MDNNNTKMCVQCGHSINKIAQFCPHCGSNTKTHNDCPKCSQKVAKDSSFCNYCGTNIQVALSDSSNNGSSVSPKVAGLRGIFYRFTLLVCLACFLFPTAASVYQYTQGKWTDEHLAIIGVSLLPLVTFLSLRWILRGAKIIK